MRAGSLRHRVTIGTYSETLDETGDVVQTWSTHAEVSARVNPVKAAEGYEAQQNVARVTHEVTIRYLATVEETMRVIYDSREFYIVGIRNPDERNIMMVIECDEKK